MSGVVYCNGEETQIYQFASNFPLGTFVPTIVQSAQKNPPPSNGTISPLVNEINLPGSVVLIFTPATASLEPDTVTRITGWIFGSNAASSLFGNGSCESFCGYMRNNFQSELFTTTKTEPPKISDCGGKNLTSREMKLAAPKDFEADCSGKLIAALTDSMWKFKKYSRKSGNPVPLPKSSEIMYGIDCNTLFWPLPHNFSVADFDPQFVDIGIESHCVKSGKSLSLTRSIANAFMFKTGRLVGSIRLTSLPKLCLSITSIVANTTATIISIATPDITQNSPACDLRRLCRNLLMSENHSFSDSISSIFPDFHSFQSPINTTTPPNPAKTEKTTSLVSNDADSENRFICRAVFWNSVALLPFIITALVVFLDIYRNRKK